MIEKKSKKMEVLDVKELAEIYAKLGDMSEDSLSDYYMFTESSPYDLIAQSGIETVSFHALTL